MGKKRKIKLVSEFRKLRNNEYRGHPTYIYEKVGNRYNFIGITHAKITKGTKNIDLEKNPNPLDKRSAYLRSSVDSEEQKKFSEKLPYWNFSDNDKKKVKDVIEKDKKKGNKKKKG